MGMAGAEACMELLGAVGKMIGLAVNWWPRDGIGAIGEACCFGKACDNLASIPALDADELEAD